MSMYPRLSGIPASAIITTLNSVSSQFESLSDEEKLRIINAAQLQVSAYRNKQDKPDYLANTVDVSIPDAGDPSVNPYVKFVYSGQTLKEVTDAIPDDGKHYSILFYNGAEIGLGYVHQSRFHIMWVGQSSSNLDFEDANFSDIGDAFNGANVIGSTFINCDFGTLTLDQFKVRIFLYDQLTTIWTDGKAFGE